MTARLLAVAKALARGGLYTGIKLSKKKDPWLLLRDHKVEIISSTKDATYTSGCGQFWGAESHERSTQRLRNQQKIKELS